jgi:serine/threonine protein kinase
MYSLGVVLFEMVAGRLPFNYKIPNKILLAHVMEEPPSPLTFNPNCPPALAEIILKTLRKSPEERYANMQALIEALKTLLYGPSLPIEAQVEAQTSETDTPAQPRPAPAKVAPEEKSLGRFFKPIRKFFSWEVPDTAELDAQAKAAPGEEDESEHTVRLGSERASAGSVPKLVGGTKKVTIEFPEGTRLVVGRTHGSNIVDINLEPHEASKYGVSRSHARFFRRENLWFLEDLHSLNGTFVNEIRLQHGQPVALKSGDTIRFSQMSFTFLVA